MAIQRMTNPKTKTVTAVVMTDGAPWAMVWGWVPPYQSPQVMEAAITAQRR